MKKHIILTVEVDTGANNEFIVGKLTAIRARPETTIARLIRKVSEWLERKHPKSPTCDQYYGATSVGMVIGLNDYTVITGGLLGDDVKHVTITLIPRPTHPGITETITV